MSAKDKPEGRFADERLLLAVLRWSPLRRVLVKSNENG